MIILDVKKLIKHEQGNVYYRSRGFNKVSGLYCDYSKDENLVEIEFSSGERKWVDIKPLFYGYAIREGIYIGVATGKIVQTYLIKSIEARQVRGCNYLYALLIPVGAQRKLDIDNDYPLSKEKHHLPMHSETAIPLSKATDEMKDCDAGCLSSDKTVAKKESSSYRFIRVKDGTVGMDVYKEHLELIFEPYCAGCKTIARVYTHSGQLLKQWKGIRFATSCQLLKKYRSYVNDEIEISASGISFNCESGELFQSMDNNLLSLYELFPSLPKY